MTLTETRDKIVEMVGADRSVIITEQAGFYHHPSPDVAETRKTEFHISVFYRHDPPMIDFSGYFDSLDAGMAAVQAWCDKKVEHNTELVASK